ncbi:MAG TPA: hypothetical protein VF826_11715 [Chloroflexia bacterium]
MFRNGYFGKRIRYAVAGAVLSGLLAACSGPSMPIPPTPTANPSADAVVSNHHHGEGGGGGGLRLITKYGGPIDVSVEEQPSQPQPSQPFTITYTLKDGQGKAVEEHGLRLTHERLMHLILVSQDLTHFQHIHPLPEGEGRYSVASAVPGAGKYLLFNEFVTAEGVTQIERDPLDTTGSSPDAQAQLTPDLGSMQRVGELETVLTTVSPKVRRRIPVTFNLDVTRDGQPVTELEPYLAAPCHIVIVSADTRQFAHTHGDVPGGPMSGDMSGMDMSQMDSMPVPDHFGPRLQFTHTFMQQGVYRIWFQFGYKGEVQTVAYNVRVDK